MQFLMNICIFIIIIIVRIIIVLIIIITIIIVVLIITVNLVIIIVIYIILGAVGFGLDEFGRCSTELYINYDDSNARLLDNDRNNNKGFAPFGIINASDMSSVIDKLYNGYGEVKELCTSELNCIQTAINNNNNNNETEMVNGNDNVKNNINYNNNNSHHQSFCRGCDSECLGVDMQRLLREGNEQYLDKEKPLLDVIIDERIVRINGRDV